MVRTSRSKRDIYYRVSRELGYRARSAFKLYQINEKFRIFQGKQTGEEKTAGERENRPLRIVDLCSCPGSWSELALKLSPTNSSIFSIDLAAIAPLPGIEFLQADITHAETLNILHSRFPDGVDLLLCDGAPDVLGQGQSDLDEFIQHALVREALRLSARLVMPGGSFVTKLFRGRDSLRPIALARRFFDKVALAKPAACRNSSLEGFLVAQGRKSSESPDALDWENFEDFSLSAEELAEAAEFPLVACEEKFGLDADGSYAITWKIPEEMRKKHASTAEAPLTVLPGLHASAPIRPPYAKSLQMKKEQKLS